MRALAARHDVIVVSSRAIVSAECNRSCSRFPFPGGAVPKLGAISPSTGVHCISTSSPSSISCGADEHASWWGIATSGWSAEGCSYFRQASTMRSSKPVLTWSSSPSAFTPNSCTRMRGRMVQVSISKFPAGNSPTRLPIGSQRCAVRSAKRPTAPSSRACCANRSRMQSSIDLTTTAPSPGLVQERRHWWSTQGRCAVTR